MNKPSIQEFAAIKEYQCPGCTSGCDPENGCFKPNHESSSCYAHSAGTVIGRVGQIFLGMPKGFNRLGPQSSMQIYIYNTAAENPAENTKFNIPAWKYVNEAGHTFVRFYSPRTNTSYIEVYLEDCRDKFNCTDLSQADIDGMD
jgi:hypothetical protein